MAVPARLVVATNLMPDKRNGGDISTADGAPRMLFIFWEEKKMRFSSKCLKKKIFSSVFSDVR
jgi:muramidase (phage lysozyme)